MPKTVTLKNVVMKAPKGKKYNPKEVSRGRKIESEHTSNSKLQTIITKNHLDEDKDYYKKLSKVEKVKRKK